MEELVELIVRGLAHFDIGPDAETVSRLAAYVGELDRWSRTMNLVGLKEGSRIVADLLYDAFFLRSRIPTGDSVLDLGSGAGILAIPLAVLDPERRVFSAEKGLKKVLFQRHAKRLLGLARLEIVHGRIEEVPPLGVDILVAKAFGPLSVILDKGGRHLKCGGSAFIVKGRGEKARAKEGFVLEQSEQYSLPASDKAYRLFVYKKVP